MVHRVLPLHGRPGRFRIRRSVRTEFFFKPDTLPQTGDLPLCVEALEASAIRVPEARRPHPLPKGEGVITRQLNVEIPDLDHAGPVFAGTQAAVNDEAGPKRPSFGFLGNDFIRGLLARLSPTRETVVVGFRPPDRCAQRISRRGLVFELEGETHRLGQSDGGARIHPGIPPSAHPPFVPGQHQQRLDPRQIGDGEAGSVRTDQTAPQHGRIVFRGHERVGGRDPRTGRGVEGDQRRVKTGGEGQHAEQDQLGRFGLGRWTLRMLPPGGQRPIRLQLRWRRLVVVLVMLLLLLRRGQLTDLTQEGGRVEKGQDGREMGLKQIEQGLPGLRGEDGGVEEIDVGLGGILDAGAGATHRLPRARSFGTIPFPIAVITIGGGRDVAFRRPSADAGRGCGIETVSVRGRACPTGAVDAGIDAFDLASPAAGAGDAGTHFGRRPLRFALHDER